jgi:hypothetical protein
MEGCSFCSLINCSGNSSIAVQVEYSDWIDIVDTQGIGTIRLSHSTNCSVLANGNPMSISSGGFNEIAGVGNCSISGSDHNVIQGTGRLGCSNCDDNDLSGFSLPDDLWKMSGYTHAHFQHINGSNNTF